jgi:hypothetical protein
MMARMNRVMPNGVIVARPERGTMMGNRGRLHDVDGRILRQWQVKRWLLCVLEFNGRRRAVMAPDRYTELFFLDEATGFAAGHRPCFECRRRKYLEFREMWAKATGDGRPPEQIKADQIDERLHTERIGPDRAKLTFSATIDDLPDGVFVTLPGREAEPHLILGGRLLTWSPGGYHNGKERPRGKRVSVLTPATIVAVIRAGYVPDVHPSAHAH